MSTFQKNWQPGISYLRILATVGVVFLHTCSTILDNEQLFPLTKFQQCAFSAGENFFRWAVPVFFMITGALLLRPGNEMPYRKIKKYIRRVLLALLIFAVPFAALMNIYEGKRDAAIVWNSFVALFTGNSFAHFWYLYAILGVYMVLPIVKAFVDKADKREIQYALICMFSFAFLTPTIQRLTGIKIAFKIPLSYHLFYILVGYYLAHLYQVKRRHVFGMPALVIAALLIFFSYASFRVSEWHFYDDPLIAVQAMLIFCAFKDIQVSDQGVLKRIRTIDRLCFAVYLVHPVFIQFTYRFLRITPMSFGRLYGLATVVLWIIFTCCAFFTSYVLNRIGLLRRYVL